MEFKNSMTIKMNQKSLRYILLGGVVLIWGIIIFRVINGLSTDDPVNLVKKKTISFNYNTTKDSFLLLANYPDPFIPENIAINETGNDLLSLPKEPVINNNPPAPKKPEFDIQLIQYHGMIANPETKMKLAVVNIAGKEYTAREGDKIEPVSIRKITKGGLIVFVEGKSFTVPIKAN